MIDEVLAKFLDYKEELRDEKWAEGVVAVMLRNTQPIITKPEYDLSHNILFGKFPQTKLDKLFTGSSMIRQKKKLSDDNTVYLFERTRNALIDERTSAQLTVTVDSLDPEKEEKKLFDKNLLINRKGIEGLLGEITQNNGMPPPKYKSDDFHGNVDQFDNNGGNDLDPVEVDNFFENEWGIKQEIHLQNIINGVVNINQLTRNFDKYINDIFICSHNFSQVYIDDISGAMRIEHLYPYNVRPLNPTGSNDYKDAEGFIVDRATNVRGFMAKFGTFFNVRENWSVLLSVANASVTPTPGIAATKYSGIEIDGGIVYGEPGKVISYSSLVNLPIKYGYAEWRKITRKVTQYVVTSEGNIIPQDVDDSAELVDGAVKKERAYEDTYRAYYIETGNFTPKIIKWGKLYMQNIEGFHDEYSGFSIKGNKRDGVPFVEIMKPFWQIMNVSFKMFEMLVNDVKPDGFMFNYTAIVKVAQYLQQAKDTPDDVRVGLEEFMKMVEESPNLLTDNPTTDAGAPMGGGSIGVQPRKNGLNDTAAELMKVMDWCEAKIDKFLGTQGVDVAEGNDGYKLTIENRRRTRAATSFIDFILLNHIEDICITILNYTKDVSKFKDIPAYKYMASLVGYKVLDFIGSMEKAPHRYGTILDTFNNDLDMQELRDLARRDVDTNRIPIEQYVVLKSIKNLRQAQAYLAKARHKADKLRQNEAIAADQRTNAMAVAAYQRQVQLENLKGEWRQKAESAKAQGFIDAARINGQTQITTKQMQEEGQDARLASSAVNEIDKVAADANKQAQKPPPVK